jgi:hypothetical protein
MILGQVDATFKASHRRGELKFLATLSSSTTSYANGQLGDGRRRGAINHLGGGLCAFDVVHNRVAKGTRVVHRVLL